MPKLVRVYWLSKDAHWEENEHRQLYLKALDFLLHKSAFKKVNIDEENTSDNLFYCDFYIPSTWTQNINIVLFYQYNNHGDHVCDEYNVNISLKTYINTYAYAFYHKDEMEDINIDFQHNNERLIMMHLLSNIDSFDTFKQSRDLLNSLVITIRQYISFFNQYLTKFEKYRQLDTIYQMILIKRVSPCHLEPLSILILYKILLTYIIKNKQIPRYALYNSFSIDFKRIFKNINCVKNIINKPYWHVIFPCLNFVTVMRPVGKV